MQDDGLSIKTITKLTGLNEHTLRAWERRYGAVQPQRLDNGRRVYTRDDVERLRKMVQLVERGYPIGRISKLNDAELAKLLSQNMELAETSAVSAAPVTANPRQKTEISEQLQLIESLLDKYDLTRIHDEMIHARVRYGARTFALDFVQPLMTVVGRLIVEGRFSIGQEHALSAIVKAHLAAISFSMARGAAPRGGRRFALATMEGDLHELGIGMSSVICAYYGHVAHYIGPNMPPEPLGEAVSALKSDVLLLGTSQLPPGTLPRSPERYLSMLSASLPAACEIWLGGPVLVNLTAAKPHQTVRILKSLQDFDALLLTSF